MPISATEAKNRFGYFCSQAKTEPVIVEKEGRPDTVLLDYDAFIALQRAAAQPKSLAQRRKEFNEKYKDWITEQNALVEQFGIPGEEFRTW